ncbi:MFS transporter [Alicyclobacillus fastidiosus]|uniref:MFS transporter n=1 Tax=Alicyclobacillus fastidiosus TaxID=392011 RepID=A0ABV5AF33_9BACL|nr:MFS transporter [Alicyclobacillus fastidiosus]WEH08709.1 MFS transporter [Alicyclobacillus fastidiosus]
MRRGLFLYFFSEFFLSFGIGMVQYAQPFFYSSAHVSDQTIGYLFAVNAFFGGCSALLMGPLADRVGASHVFKWATLTIGLGSLCTSVVTSVPVWTVTAALSGVGGSMLTSTENVVLSSLLTGRERSHLISRFTALYMVFIGMGVIFAGWFVHAHGLRATMVVGSAVSLVAPVFRFFVKAPDSRRARVLQLPSKPLVFMAGYAILFGIAGGLFNPFATLILQQRYHASSATTSLVYAVSLFMVSLGSYLVRPMIERMRQQATLFLSFVLSACSTMLFIVAMTSAAFVAIYFVVTITTAVPPPIIDAMFLDFVHTSEFSQMFGMRVFGTRVGNAVGSSLGGSLLHGNHYNWLMVLSCVFFLISYGYLLVVRRPLMRRASERSQAE